MIFTVGMLLAIALMATLIALHCKAFTATREQPLLLRSILLRIADSTQHGPFIGEERAEPSNDQSFKIAGWDPWEVDIWRELMRHVDDTPTFCLNKAPGFNVAPDHRNCGYGTTPA